VRLVKSFALVVLCARGAQAEDCARPDVVDTVPIDGAREVPTNATLIARYAISAEYLGEQVFLGEAGSDPVAFTASYNEAERLLTFTPPEGLTPGVEYEIEWPGLRGLNTANKGLSRKLHFFAGSAADGEPPSFDGLVGVEWDLEREDDECTDRIEDRFVFELNLGAAFDDGGRDALSLVVFQTLGPTVASDAPKPIHVGHFPAPGERVRLVDTVSATTGRICFAALARDSTRLSSSGGQEHCVTTVEPPFFEGCSLGGRGSGLKWPLLLFGAVGLWGKRRRRSRAAER
jgi:MYXO-CTERM domain-containing protein